MTLLLPTLAWPCGAGCGQQEQEVTTHVRARVATDFKYAQAVWVDVVVRWGSDCQAEEWFLTSGPVPGIEGYTNDIFASLPATFDVLPRYPDGNESVTIFVAARDTIGVLSTAWRSVQFEPGKRVTTELFLADPCAPLSCEPDYDATGSEPENWCNLSLARLKQYRADACSCE